MCKFCEGLFDKDYKMEWNTRSEYADSNFCEKVLNNECSKCKQCFTQYKLDGFISNENTYIVCDYKFTNGDIVMWNSTEPLRINYCPYCGKRISKDIIDLNSIEEHIVDIVINENGDSWDYESYKLDKI